MCDWPATWGGLAAGGTHSLAGLGVVLTLFQLPVHHIADDGGRQQTKELQHAEYGGVDAHWETGGDREARHSGHRHPWQ